MKHKLTVRLSISRPGRILLHCAAAILDGHWSYHMPGIIREIAGR